MSNEIKKECTGCKIANEGSNFTIFETENFILTQDPEVPIKGFLIIQSKKHFNSIIDLNEEQQIELIKLTNRARLALKELNICQEVTIVQEERSKHFHIWLFPNYKWMQEKFGKGIKYLRDINEYVIQNATEQDKKELFEVVQNLKEYFNKEV